MKNIIKGQKNEWTFQDVMEQVRDLKAGKVKVIWSDKNKYGYWEVFTDYNLKTGEVKKYKKYVMP